MHTTYFCLPRDLTLYDHALRYGAPTSSCDRYLTLYPDSVPNETRFVNPLIIYINPFGLSLLHFFHLVYKIKNHSQSYSFLHFSFFIFNTFVYIMVILIYIYIYFFHMEYHYKVNKSVIFRDSIFQNRVKTNWNISAM